MTTLSQTALTEEAFNFWKVKVKKLFEIEAVYVFEAYISRLNGKKCQGRS